MLAFSKKKLKNQILITSRKNFFYQNGKLRALLFLLKNNIFHGRPILRFEVALSDRF